MSKKNDKLRQSAEFLLDFDSLTQGFTKLPSAADPIDGNLSWDDTPGLIVHPAVKKIMSSAKSEQESVGRRRRRSSSLSRITELKRRSGSSPLTNSILFCWLFAIIDQCLKLCFLYTF